MNNPTSNAEIVDCTISYLRVNGYGYFPAGDFEIADTIDLGAMVGVRLTGAGQVYQRKRTPVERRTTRLIWRGPPDQPMIRGSIRHGVFQDIALVDGRLDIVPTHGLGTGFCNFDRMSFIGPPAGVKFGDVALNGNAADSTFRDCQFVQCEAPIELTTSQNVNYRWTRCVWYRTPRCVLVRGGGLATLDGCYLHSTNESMIVFDVRGDGQATSWQNGLFTIRDLKCDAGGDKNPTPPPIFVRDTSRGISRVLRRLRLDGIHAPRGYTPVHSDSTPWRVEEIVELKSVRINTEAPEPGEVK